MHELSIAQALAGELESIVRSEGARAVSRVTLAVGALSGVEPEALRLAFPVAMEGTAAAHAELVLQRIPAQVRCRTCGQDTEPDFPVFVCGHCGSSDIDIAAGRELLIQSVELDVPDAS